MKIARQGLPFVLGFLTAGAVPPAAVAALGGRWPAILLAAAPGLALAGFSAYFFRDPERHPPAGEGIVLAPADGRVVKVHDGPHGPHVAIFLSVFDVHINRSPIAGRVESVTYREGRFLAAYDERAGEANERNDIVVAGPAGPVEVSQIAGILARRIVCSIRTGDRLALGQRMGLIRFGSRTDLRLPPRSTVEVVLGQRVRGGETIVGYLPPRRAGEQTSLDAVGEVSRAGAGTRGVR